MANPNIVNVTSIYGKTSVQAVGTGAADIVTNSASSGYVVKINPPIEHKITGEDVEGIGWVPYSPYVKLQHFHGWYKYKCDAVKCADAMNKSLSK